MIYILMLYSTSLVDLFFYLNKWGLVEEVGFYIACGRWMVLESEYSKYNVMKRKYCVSHWGLINSLIYWLYFHYLYRTY